MFEFIQSIVNLGEHESGIQFSVLILHFLADLQITSELLLCLFVVFLTHTDHSFGVVALPMKDNQAIGKAIRPREAFFILGHILNSNVLYFLEVVVYFL